MNILNRFLLALAFCSIGILVAFEVSFDESRNGALCREVDHELNVAVREKILKPEKTSAIAQRCYQRK